MSAKNPKEHYVCEKNYCSNLWNPGICTYMHLQKKKKTFSKKQKKNNYSNKSKQKK